MSTIEETQGSINSSWYCSRCRAAFMQKITDNNGKSEPKIVIFNDKFTGRFLMCGHAINVQDQPVHSIGETKVEFDGFNKPLDPSMLRDLNVSTTLEVSKMNDEQLEQAILNHVEEYKFHLAASKKEKYLIQLYEDLVQKRIDSVKAATKEEEDRIRQNLQVKFGYIFRKPERRLELLAKDKVKAEKAQSKEVLTTDNAVAKMRELMKKLGVSKEQLGIVSNDGAK